ncbi:MAG TPA: tripartite tricarboxylate transporter substrate binding protein [Syntrophomonas sp.]|nr:tripartite tricarboxylate transporter substrate binding protein [Syntrophomonas sp.]
MKKNLALMVIFALVLISITGCSQQAPSNVQPDADQIDYPNKAIKIIVPFAAGGGTDLSARLLAGYLEKELEVPVVIENKPGGGGWIGWAELLKAEPDGYTLSIIAAPSVIAGYLNPSAKRSESLDSFDLIINHVKDPIAIAVSANNSRFGNIKDLIEYAKQNELTAPANGVGTYAHLATLKMNKQLGTQFRTIHFDGGGESISNVIGGHVDVFVGAVSEVAQFQKDGVLKVLAVLESERISQLPDVPTLNESLGVDLTFNSIRSFVAPKGTDPRIIEKLQSAIEKAMNNPQHIEKADEMGIILDSTKGEALYEMLKEKENAILEVRDQLGW